MFQTLIAIFVLPLFSQILPGPGRMQTEDPNIKGAKWDLCSSTFKTKDFELGFEHSVQNGGTSRSTTLCEGTLALRIYDYNQRQPPRCVGNLMTEIVICEFEFHKQKATAYISIMAENLLLASPRPEHQMLFSLRVEQNGHNLVNFANAQKFRNAKEFRQIQPAFYLRSEGSDTVDVFTFCISSPGEQKCFPSNP